MMVRSESCERAVDTDIKLCPEPVPTSSPSDGGQGRDGVKKGSKRIFPLYDNFSRSVKRHREKSREREKSRDRIKQRDRLKLKEEEQRVNSENGANLASEKVGAVDGLVEDQRGRDKVKEKKRFYQRDKSKEKKKNKDKVREDKEVDETQAEIRRADTKDTSRPSSTYSCREELIYGKVERQGGQLASSIEAPISVAPGSAQTLDLFISSKTTPRAKLCASISTPSFSEFSERSVDVPRLTTCHTAAPPTSQPWINTSGNVDYSAVYGGLPGCRRGLYESPLGKYGSPTGRYFTLERSGARRPSEHEYETFETVLTETGMKSVVESEPAKNIEKQDVGSTVRNAQNGTSHSGDEMFCSTRQNDFCVSTEEDSAVSQSQSPIFTKTQSTPQQPSELTSPADCVTGDDVTSEALSALGAPDASPAAGEQEGQTAGQSANSAVATGPDTLLRSVSVPAEGCEPAAGSPSEVLLTQADSAVADRRCTAPQTAAAPPPAPVGASVVQPGPDDATAAPEPAADKARSSRKFLSFHSRVAGGSGGKASAKRSFLSNLLRPDGGSPELSVERPATQDGSKVRSLPAKYRDFFRDKKTDRLEQFSESVEVVTTSKSVVNADKNKDSITVKSSDPEVVEIELPGVFGHSQMRASLRITLKNHSDSCAAGDKPAASAESSNRQSHRSGGLGGEPAALRRSTRSSRSRSQPRRTSDQRMSIAIPPATVAALTNKFNALIQSTSAESSPSPTGTKTFNLGSIALDKSGNVSKSASFRRTDGARCSTRRRQASERADKQSRETTEALVNRASDVLSREIAGLLQARTVSGSAGASGCRSGPGSFRTGKGGDAGVSGAAKESGSALSSRTASFRRTRANGVGAGVARDSSRLSNRRRPGDVRNDSSRNIGWTSAVRTEQKKNVAAKCSSSLASDNSSDVRQASNSNPEKRNATFLKSEAQPLSENRTPSNSSPDVSTKAKNSQPVQISSKCSRLQDISNPQNASKKENEKLTQTAGLRALATKPADWPKRKRDDDAGKTAALAGDVKSSTMSKPGRQSVDVSRVYDRELRKITNTGTVAKASELWLKRAQSSNEVNTFKKKTTTSTPSSQRPPGMATDSKVTEKAQSLCDIALKSATATDINKPSGSFSSVPKNGLKQKLASNSNGLQDPKDSLEKSETESTEKSSTNITLVKIELTGCASNEPKNANNTGRPCGDTSPKETKQTTEDAKWSGVAKRNLLENRIYGAPSMRGLQKRTTPSMFENKLYGATFTPIKDTINKYVTVAAQGGSRQSDSKTPGRNTHVPAGKSLSLKSLPASSPVSRVKEAIHRFEVPSPTNPTNAKSPTDETALKSTTLPSRLPTSGGAPSSRCIGPGMSRNPQCPGAERSHGFYESLWDGRREYKPNESFLWHGCSQLTSGGESPGSVTSSISNSDRDTASSLSDASSAADEDAAARGRGSLWRRLRLTRVALAEQLPNPAGEYEPTGGSSSSGTVTYENGSDPGYERISGDSCVGYEQIGSAISGSTRYERIGEPPPSEATSAGYETLAPPSEASTLCYDDCVVPARLAVVNEHQTESLNYLDSGSAQYEDIGGVWSSQSAKDGRAPHEHLKSTLLQTCDEEHEETEGSEDGPQTVNSYQLTDFGGGDDQVATPAGQQTSLPSTPRARAASDRDTAGEWTDIDADGEQEASDDTEDGTQSPLVITRPHLVRMRNRSRRFSKTRAGRRSWAQSMRNLNNLNSEQEQLQLEGSWRHTLTGGETDEEWLEDNHLYEALDSHYEPVEAVPEAVDSDDAADDDEKELGDEDLDQDQHTNGMQKIAQGMRRRLQKTKSDIRSGIIRFRKSTSAGAESPAVSVGIKPRWLLKKHLPRAKKGPSSPGTDSKFYLDLDLVIQPRTGEEPRPTAEEEADAHSESDMGSARSSVRRSDTGSLSSLQPADSRVRLPSTQSSSSQTSAASAAAATSTMRKTCRPRNSPPAPPAPLPAAAANSPHPALPPDTSASPGFARALSTESQPPARSLSTCRQSTIDMDVAPPLPPPAARGTRPPSIQHQASCGELSDRVSRPRLERSAASVGSAMTSLGDLTYAAGHDNTEYMLAAESDKPGEDVEEEEPYTSLREREPLYQVYMQNRCYQESISGESEDDYETIQEDTAGADSDVMVTSSTGAETAESSPPPLPPPPLRKRVTSRPSALQLLSSPTEGQRSLWCQLPEVIGSGLLEKMSSEEKRLQEAMFEVITSEASYQKSLSVLVRHFQEDPALCQFQSPDCVLKKADFQDLFSNVEKVHQCSEAFLTALERRWQEDVTLSGLGEVIQRHAHTHFHVYKQYCANQTVQDRKLKELREKSPAFVEVLRRLESCPQCQSLTLHSFLMLPMQRVTRLPMLVSAILVRLEPGHPEYSSCQQAYQALTQLAKDCNEEACRRQRLEELVSISRLLVFKDTKQFPLVKPSRWLVKKGELLRTVYKAEDSKMTFGRKQSKQQTVWVFLFNDLLIISKKKSDESYVVLDWCLRNMVQLTENAEDRADRFLLTLLSNHEGRTVEMLFSCQVESERVRWVQAVTPQTQNTGTETVYETWDCPQVQAVHPYTAQQPDEITLHVGEVLKVLRKVPGGWYHGMRLSDSASGWFPSNYCREIMSEHVKARNLRERYQVLRIADDYLRQERERKMKGSDKESAKGGSPAS